MDLEKAVITPAPARGKNNTPFSNSKRIDPLQFMGMRLQLEDKTIDFSSQEDKNLLFCPPDEAALTSHARGL
ncbi:hypothetical protein AC249_AIPGENE13122 [Exaiptasia diaphana]|nr:hypothetical protein AC249_AIPGENE13122 [Exaiptasia diaphana]